MTAGGSHWPRHAQQWNLVGSPLRPGPADVAEFHRRLQATQAKEVLLFGVTPELAQIRYPARLVAAERDAAVIWRLWQSDPPPGGAAVCADWRALPFPDSYFDAAFGDGVLNMMQGATALTAFATEAQRVLKPGGVLVLRVFMHPDTQETPEAVVAALHHGRIGSFHSFKWRLAMALHGSLEEGVRLGDIWRCWRALVPAPGELLNGLGWEAQLVDTIDIYRDVDTRYCFPRRHEIGTIFAGSFKEIGCEVQQYELAERCPIIALRRL